MFIYYLKRFVKIVYFMSTSKLNKCKVMILNNEYSTCSWQLPVISCMLILGAKIYFVKLMEDVTRSSKTNPNEMGDRLWKTPEMVDQRGTTLSINIRFYCLTFLRNILRRCEKYYYLAYFHMAASGSSIKVMPFKSHLLFSIFCTVTEIDEERKSCNVFTSK